MMDMLSTRSPRQTSGPKELAGPDSSVAPPSPRRVLAALCGGAASGGALWLFLEHVAAAVIERRTNAAGLQSGHDHAGAVTHYIVTLLLAASLSGVFGGMVAAVTAGCRRVRDAAIAGAVSAGVLAAVSALLVRLYPRMSDSGSLALLAVPLVAAGAMGGIIGHRLEIGAGSSA